MYKRIILLLGFLSLFSFISAQHGNISVPEKSHQAEGIKTPDEVALENKEIINHHLLDAHSFTITQTADGGHFEVPLPVIFYDKENGLHTMMSSAFHHGEEKVDTHGKGYYVIESKGQKYALYHEKIYKTDNSGTININDKGFAENKKVIDLSITKGVLSTIIAAAMMLLIFIGMAKGYAKNAVPKGFARFMEPIVIFIRDEIAKPTIGPKYKKYMSFLLTVFFFILFLNFFGLLPLGINVTGNISVTFALAIITFIITQFTANANYWKHIFWMPGVPVLIKLLMLPIEFLGIFIKPFTLMIRLFANMSAGHIVVMSLIAMIYYFKNVIAGVAFPLLTLLIYVLEILVAVIQAYIFTMLSAVYFGMANEEHHHEEAH